jgi:hypothetical protein
MTPTFFYTNDETYLSTTYYNNTTPPSYITPPPNGKPTCYISDLTSLKFCWHLLFLVCFSIVTFLPSHLKKKRTSKSITNTNINQTDQEYPDLTTTPPTPTATTQYTTAQDTQPAPTNTLPPSDIRVLRPSIIGNTNRSCDNIFFAATWNLLSILICMIPMSTFLRPKRKHIATGGET